MNVFMGRKGTENMLDEAYQPTPSLRNSWLAHNIASKQDLNRSKIWTVYPIWFMLPQLSSQYHSQNFKSQKEAFQSPIEYIQQQLNNFKEGWNVNTLCIKK